MGIGELDNGTLVSVLYEALLNRNPDPEGIRSYVSELDNQRKTLHEVALEILGSTEFLRGRNQYSDTVKEKLLLAGYEPNDATKFGEFLPPPTEAAKAYSLRLNKGFFARYCRGEVVLDIGFTGYANSEKRTSLPGAIGVDLDFPGYDGVHLPWPDQSVDCVFSSHCLEHIQFYQEVIRDWHRVVKYGGYIVCIVPSRDLYEKKEFPPSRYNADHKRFYTAGRLLSEFEEALEPNSFRVRHVHDNDFFYNYSLGPETHAVGCYEIELVVEKMLKPSWTIK